MIRRLADDRRGTALIEFAIVLPVLLMMFFGAYQLSDAIACKRRVTVMARAVGDLTSQYRSLDTDDLDTFMGASTQIMAPYASAPAHLRVTQISVESTGLFFTIDWSRARDNDAPAGGNPTGRYPASMLPLAFRQPGMTFIYTEASYDYRSVLPKLPNFSNDATFSQSIWLLPRRSASITLTS